MKALINIGNDSSTSTIDRLGKIFFNLDCLLTIISPTICLVIYTILDASLLYTIPTFAIIIPPVIAIILHKKHHYKKAVNTLVFSTLIIITCSTLITHSYFMPLYSIPLGISFFIYMAHSEKEAIIYFSVFVLIGIVLFIAYYSFLYHETTPFLKLVNTISISFFSLLLLYKTIVLIFIYRTTIKINKKKERALLDSEAKYRTQFEKTQLGLLILDKNLVVQDTNPALSSILGYSKEEILDQKIFNHYLAQTPELHKQLKELVAEKKRQFTANKKLQKKDGTYIFTNVFITNIYNNNGDFINMNCSILDVTAVKTTQDQLIKSNHRLQSIFQTSALGIAIADSNNFIIEANLSFAKMLGYTPEELVGISIKAITYPEDIELNEKKTSELLSGKRDRVELKKRYIRKNKSIFWARIWINIFSEENNIKFQATIKDISDQIKWEEDIINKNIKLKKYIESNHQLENFAHIASHDLKAPLRTITSYVQLISNRSKHKLDKTEAEFLDFIVGATKNMSKLIEALLTYSKADSQKTALKSFDLNALIDTIIKDLNIDIQENNITINVGLLPTSINADIMRMRQLFQNLMTNSIKFKSITSPPFISIECEEDSNAYFFKFKDNGIGIAPEFHQKVFNIFTKLHGSNEYEGSGIGLALCKKIVEQHNGKIWIESVPGEGTTFNFTISKTIGTKDKCPLLEHIPMPLNLQ